VDEKSPYPDRAHLETRVWDYVRAGWSVVEQTGVNATLKKGELVTRLSLDQDGKIVTDGAELPTFFFDGRARAWLILLAVLIITYAAAYLLGLLR
jgi:hypothetical protein